MVHYSKPNKKFSRKFSYREPNPIQRRKYKILIIDTGRSLLQKSGINVSNFTIDQNDSINLKHKPFESEAEDYNSNTNQIETIQSEPNANDNLFNIIKKLSHNNCLNNIIKSINKFVPKKFDKSNISINLKGRELDKFSDKKNIDIYSVRINYSLE